MGKFFTLSYDIPSSAVRPGSPPLGQRGAQKYPNPSGRLRRVGFRYNKSCWVIPEDRRPNHLLAELIGVGSDVVDLPFDDAGTDKILGLAVKEMEREATATRQTAEKAVKKAEDAYATNVATLGSEQAALLYKKATYNALKAAERVLKALEAAKAVFGVEPDLLTANKKIGALQASTAAQAASYVSMAKAAATLAATSPTAANKGLAHAAATDAIPAGPLQDALLDADALPAGAA